MDAPPAQLSVGPKSPLQDRAEDKVRAHQDHGHSMIKASRNLDEASGGCGSNPRPRPSPFPVTCRPGWRPCALRPEIPAQPHQCFGTYLGPQSLQHLPWSPAPSEISPSGPHLPLPPPHWGQQPYYTSIAQALGQVFFLKLPLPLNRQDHCESRDLGLLRPPHHLSSLRGSEDRPSPCIIERECQKGKPI